MKEGSCQLSPLNSQLSSGSVGWALAHQKVGRTQGLGCKTQSGIAQSWFSSMVTVQ